MTISTLTKYRLKNIPPEVAAARMGGTTAEFMPLPLELQAFGFGPQAQVGDLVPLFADELGKDVAYDPLLKHCDGWFNFVEAI